MLVYDITSEKSFENIRNWIRNIDDVSMAVYANSYNCMDALNDVICLASDFSLLKIGILL